MGTMRLEERNGLFFAKCVLHATPDMEIWGLVDSGSVVTFLTSSVCERAGLKYKGKQPGIVCSHGKSHRDIKIDTYRSVITLGGITVKCTSLAYNGRLGAGGIRADAILGHNVLCHFDGSLGWKGRTGTLEW